jgi:hypothetical protein
VNSDLGLLALQEIRGKLILSENAKHEVREPTTASDLKFCSVRREHEPLSRHPTTSRNIRFSPDVRRMHERVLNHLTTPEDRNGNEEPISLLGVLSGSR